MRLDPYPLADVYRQLNLEHFDGELDPPVLRWNSRLRTSAGRFIPGSRKWFQELPPVIEVASYLLEELDGARHIRDTLAHEMIHYWLWVRRKPYGHTAEFMVKMRAMGTLRYNPVPRRRPYKYKYKCPACHKEFPSRRKLSKLACKRCCIEHAGGRYDSRFTLQLMA